MYTFWGMLTLGNGLLAGVNYYAFATTWNVANLIFGSLCVIGAWVSYAVTQNWKEN